MNNLYELTFYIPCCGEDIEACATVYYDGTEFEVRKGSFKPIGKVNGRGISKSEFISISVANMMFCSEAHFEILAIKELSGVLEDQELYNRMARSEKERSMKLPKNTIKH